MENNLPKGWITCSPFNIADKVRGVSYDKKDVSFTLSDGLIPVLRANNIDDNRLIYEDLVYAPEKSINKNQLLQEGDVVIAMSSGSKKLVGKTAQYFESIKISFGAFCGVLRPNRKISLKFFGYYFQSKEYRNAISDLSAGTNINNLKNEHFDVLQIPIAPLNEQYRIVAKLDALFSKIENNKKRIERIPKLLKRFRQAVLAAAVSGRLVNQKAEWKEVELRTLIDEGGVFDGPFGSNLKTAHYTDKGVRVIRLENIEHLNFIQDKETYIAEEKYQTLIRHTVSEGDIIFSSFITDEIRACILPSLETKAIAKADCFCIRPCEDKIDKFFLLYSLVSNYSYNQLVLDIHGATRPRINTSQLKKLMLLIPELGEQKEIVRRVKQLFAFADKIEARFTKAKVMLDKLPQGVLAKAFCGELVPQDPEDEPASILLEKIKAEKGGAVVEFKAKKKSRQE